MKNETLMSYESLSDEKIIEYIKGHNDVDEITCLVPKDDNKIHELLWKHGFRHIGKRIDNNKVMVVFKWFKGQSNEFEDMASFFDRRVDDYDLMMRDGDGSYEMGLMNITSHIVPTTEKVTILDLGCGTGAELEFVFKRVPNVHVMCVDVSEGMLQKLGQVYKNFKNNIEMICGSYIDMDFGLERYDYVIACNTFHHLLKEEKLLLYKNIKKSMKKNGIILIEDYVVSEEEERECRTEYLDLIEKGLINRNEIYHIDLPLSEGSEKDLLEAAGFLNICIKRVGDNWINIIAGNK